MDPNTPAGIAAHERQIEREQTACNQRMAYFIDAHWAAYNQLVPAKDRLVSDTSELRKPYKCDKSNYMP